MGVINKISFVCGGGAPTEFPIGLVDTNDAGINAILATIPSSYGTYTYSHTVNGGSVTSQLTANETSGCQATLFKDNVGYSTSGSCCATIEPSSLLSTDAGNLLSIGTDGRIYFNGSGGVDIYVDGATINPLNFELTLTDNSGTTPNVVLPLNILRQTTAPIVVQGISYPSGTDFQTILDALIDCCPTVNTTPLATVINPAVTQTANFNEYVTDSNGDVFYIDNDGTAQQINTPVPVAQTASTEPFTPIPASATSTGITSTITQDAVGELDTEVKLLQDQPQIFAKVGGVQTTNNIAHTEAEVAVRTGAVNIGGLTAPTFGLTPKLRIEGSEDITESFQTPMTTNQNLGVWYKNGTRFIHNMGTVNTFVGQSSGNFTLTGIHNVGNGFNTLSGLTTGSQNTAVGSSSMTLNTTGTSNSAFGYRALANNTTGLQNTGIGSTSLLFNISGFSNNAIGVNSLFFNNGNNNSSSGALSLYNNTTGNQNTADGSEGLGKNTIGNDNVGIGYRALYQNTTQSQNTALGSRAFEIGVPIGTFTLTPLNTTQLTISPALISPIGSILSVSGNPTTNTIPGFTIANTYRVVNSTTIEAIHSSVLFGATGSVTGLPLQQEQNFTNTSAIGYNSQPTASNQVQLGNLAVTEVRTAGAYFGTAFNIVSDKRNKYIGDVVASKTLFGEKIDIYEYQLISDGSWHLGVIAQDVEAIEAKRGRFILTSKSYGLNYRATIEQFNSILGTSYKFYSDLYADEQEVKNKIVEAQGITLKEAEKIQEKRDLVERLKLEVDEEGNSTYNGEHDKYLAKYIGFDLTGDETFRKYHVFEDDMLSLSTAINTVLV